MDAARLAAFARGLVAPASRRAAGRFLAWLGLAGLLTSVDAAPAGAGKDEQSRKGKRPRKKKPKLNQFGCVDVGGFCRNNGQCCSNICSGKKNRKSCQAHDDGFGACAAGPLGFCGTGRGLIVGIPCTSSADVNGLCFTTTGKAPYCAVGDVQTSGCVSCQKDLDCEEFCGEGAACIRCPACEADLGVSTACAGVTPDSCQF